MAETADTPVPWTSVVDETLDPGLRALAEAVADVARRLGHDVLALEHLLVVAAENGMPELADEVPGLAAFREALLDALHEDRAAFRLGNGDDQHLWIRPELVGLLERVQAGENGPAVLLELLHGAGGRVARALEFARDTAPDVLPPDSAELLPEPASRDGETAPAEDVPAPAGPRAAAPLEIPFTDDLGRSASEDPPLIGRAALVEQVARVLLRLQEPAVLLVGASGSGKTAFVRGLARGAADGSITALAGFRFFQLQLLELVAQAHRGQDVHAILDQILTLLAGVPSAVLVVDDLHLLVAKQGYPLTSDLIDTIRLHVNAGKLRALLTVDAGIYERTFSGDGAFGSQISVRPLPLLERAELASVAEVYRPRLERHFDLSIGPDALEAAVTASLLVESADYVPPGATIRLLDEACAMARAEGADTVTAAHVRRCSSDEHAGQPHFDHARLKDIENRLAEQVLGQEQAAGQVARRVRLAKLHLDRKPERPDGVFLFMGPSGVGKTEMARALARALYDDESRLVRLDMSEYMEPHSIARIIGAPPGYVGYGEEGALTGPVAQLDHCVVLLDEVEKAHPRVLNLFLQVFDDGRLTDSKGRVVRFANTVVIMTSNIGRELYAIHGQAPIGFGSRDDRSGQPLLTAVQDHLLRVLPSEFVNRIDEIVTFRVLDEDDIRRIARRLLDLEAARWIERGKRVVYTDAVVEVIALSGYDPRLGARHIERSLERLVSSLISDAAVTDGFETVRELALDAVDGVVCLRLDGKPFECLSPEGGITTGGAPTAAPAPPPPRRARTDRGSRPD